MVGDIRGATVTFLFLQPHHGVYFKYVGGSIQYALQCKNLTSIISLKVLLVANEMMRMKVFKFYVYFCLQYSVNIPLYDFNLSVQKKKILKKVLIENFCNGRCNCYFLQFLNKKLPISLIIGYPIFLLKPVFVHASYIICIINVFHSVNLTLCTVTSIQSIWKMKKEQLETQKQDRSCQRIQGSKENETQLKRKRLRKKKRQGIQEKILIDTP